MLGRIQSLDFIKKLFSLIKEKTRLNILKYNKEIQKKLEITIETIKKTSGKYIVYESPTKAKEIWISTEKMVYEGDYLNGKRNGKGKEYYYHSGKLIFEGEYLNGKRNGKGKEYNNKGELIIDSE